MITKKMIVVKLVEYMNGRLPQEDLVRWAETLIGDESIDERTTFEVLAYLGAADANGFPLGWSQCHDLLRQLGAQVRVDLIPARGDDDHAAANTRPPQPAFR